MILKLDKDSNWGVGWVGGVDLKEDMKMNRDDTRTWDFDYAYKYGLEKGREWDQKAHNWTPGGPWLCSCIECHEHSSMVRRAFGLGFRKGIAEQDGQ